MFGRIGLPKKGAPRAPTKRGPQVSHKYGAPHRPENVGQLHDIFWAVWSLCDCCEFGVATLKTKLKHSGIYLPATVALFPHSHVLPPLSASRSANYVWTLHTQFVQFYACQ